MNQIEINKALELHNLWLINPKEGERANFSWMSLKGINFSCKTLTSIDFINTDLENTDFSNSDLVKVDFSCANLSGADFYCSNLNESNFKDAILKRVSFRNTVFKDVSLNNAIGNNDEILTIQTGYYNVIIFEDTISIGCKTFKYAEWLKFDNEIIKSLDSPINSEVALDFWLIWKPILVSIMNSRNQFI